MSHCQRGRGPRHNLCYVRLRVELVLRPRAGGAPGLVIHAAGDDVAVPVKLLLFNYSRGSGRFYKSEGNEEVSE